jgi:hypothetical protein
MALILNRENLPQALPEYLGLRAAFLEGFDSEGFSFVGMEPEGNADHAGLRDGALAAAWAKALLAHGGRP